MLRAKTRCSREAQPSADHQAIFARRRTSANTTSERISAVRTAGMDEFQAESTDANLSTVPQTAPEMVRPILLNARTIFRGQRHDSSLKQHKLTSNTTKMAASMSLLWRLRTAAFLRGRPCLCATTDSSNATVKADPAPGRAKNRARGKSVGVLSWDEGR